MANFEMKIFSTNGVIQWDLHFADYYNDTDTQKVFDVARELKKALEKIYSINQLSE